MPTTYKPAGREASGLLEQVMKTDHPELAQSGITVLVQMADNPTRHPLKKNGVAVYATVEITNPKQRSRGTEDVCIYLDAAEWDLHDEDWRRVLLSQQLECLLVVRSKKTKKVKYDSAGRPCLRKRPPDFSLSGYWRQGELHKGRSIEVQAFANLHRQFVQRDLFNQF